jgi:hypothetical protein
MPQKAAERFMADLTRTDPDRLRSALVAMADLELGTRGGTPLGGRRQAFAGDAEETLAVLAIRSATS